MTREPLKNLPASVRDRLTQRARAAGENVQLILTRYAIERLLYRLSVSQHRERFILKGAIPFSLWGPTPYRATGDLDLLGAGNPERRGTTPPIEIPFGLSETFAADPVQQTQWQAFLPRTEVAMAREPLNQIIPSIASFLMPVFLAAADEQTSLGKWPVGGPWGD
ncbi:nucleotidyltransferase AbiEii toxin of type IV toxin-antitoxin system [Methylosinus sp. sav-2]|uniref:nucleotidyl transferase AbiEii/AbiGii toxin family protein n=1 Tax=Methylosinus sp. sav-2 TaxID=2485168 RepID=UPI00047CD42E|nr:nucleotidyl transferase AbiEii/AbiGii toxin family protein [Methylosinus sp. sav-2]TDX60533.1 nucleotidyltransferase AbiEii toxin of type IV toxin-antitoxin system [Methylosinus sp. sav-2]